MQREELSDIDNQYDYNWYCRSNCKKLRMIQNSKENHCIKFIEKCQFFANISLIMQIYKYVNCIVRKTFSRSLVCFSYIKIYLEIGKIAVFWLIANLKVKCPSLVISLVMHTYIMLLSSLAIFCIYGIY